jgi:lipopolysaccharide biosynthesis regulator YciM
LALDYLKAGLLDRAEAALLKLEGTPFETQAQLALLANYERSRDWTHAAQIAQKLEFSKQGNFSGRLAHYLCEKATVCTANKDYTLARSLLEEAINTAPAAPRPRIDLARFFNDQGQPENAYQTLEKSFQSTRAAIPLIAGPFAQYAIGSMHTQPALELLKANYEQSHGTGLVCSASGT